jgi:GT2 family glycosyltransferase
VPSCKLDPAPHDFTGELDLGSLYAGNMVLPRDRVLAFGGFDERFDPLGTAEDCDFAYRWLRAGLSLRYEPELVVHHHDWRSDEELARLYVKYGRGLGALYARRLLERDRLIVPFVARDVRAVVALLRDRLLGRPIAPYRRWALPSGLPLGLVSGLRRLGPHRAGT